MARIFAANAPLVCRAARLRATDYAWRLSLPRR
jgi:hypothetical protein